MIFQSQLRIPGPTPLPERVVRAASRPMIDHRGPDFAELLAEIATIPRHSHERKTGQYEIDHLGSQLRIGQVVDPTDQEAVVSEGALQGLEDALEIGVRQAGVLDPGQ